MLPSFLLSFFFFFRGFKVSPSGIENRGDKTTGKGRKERVSLEQTILSHVSWRESAAPSKKTSKGSSSKSPRGPANSRTAKGRGGSISRWGRAVGPLIELRNFARHVSSCGRFEDSSLVFSWRRRRLCFADSSNISDRTRDLQGDDFLVKISLFRMIRTRIEEFLRFFKRIRGFFSFKDLTENYRHLSCIKYII